MLPNPVVTASVLYFGIYMSGVFKPLVILFLNLLVLLFLLLKVLGRFKMTHCLGIIGYFNTHVPIHQSHYSASLSKLQKLCCYSVIFIPF